MVFLALLAAATMAPGDGKIAALDDWHAMTILEVGWESPAYYLRVKTGDLDGDGRADEAYVKLVCADGVVKEATYTVKSPRDSASGQASGKRMHKPVTFVKEWGPTTPMLSAVKPTYNVKNMQGSRLADDGWFPMALSNADGLCPATAAAAAAIVKSKSNITNN
jgi:hypothetical protein